MKKIIGLVVLLLVCSFSSEAFAQRNQQFCRIRDGVDSSLLATVLSSLSDTLTTAHYPIVTVGLVFAWDGSLPSALLVGASGELQVTDVATRPGEDAGNDYRKTKKDDTGVYFPAPTEGTAVDDAGTDIVCASTYVLNLPNFSVFVKNAGGGTGDAFTDVDVQFSYDNTNWESLTSTACDTLTSGNFDRCYQGTDESLPYIRVVAACGAGDDTTADCLIVGNKD
jgi:hypothetical protein